MDIVRQRIGQTAQLTFGMVDRTRPLSESRRQRLRATRRPTRALRGARGSAGKPRAPSSARSVRATSSALSAPLMSPTITSSATSWSRSQRATSSLIPHPLPLRARRARQELGKSAGRLQREAGPSRPRPRLHRHGPLRRPHRQERRRVHGDHARRDGSERAGHQRDSRRRVQISMGGGRGPQVILKEAQGLVTVLNQGAYQAPVYKVPTTRSARALGMTRFKPARTPSPSARSSSSSS